MHEMFGCQMTLCYFCCSAALAKRAGTIIEGYFEDSTATGFWGFGWTLSFIRARCNLYTANCLASHLHFGHLARGCWQTYRPRWRTNLWPLLKWDKVQYQALPQLYELTGALLLVVCVLTMRGEHDGDTEETEGGSRFFTALPARLIGLSPFDTGYTIKSWFSTVTIATHFFLPH